MISLIVEAGDDGTQYYEHTASELQSGISITGIEIKGTVNKVSGIVNFVGDNTDYHLVLKLTADGGVTIETKMTGGATVMKGYVTVDDGYCVYSVTDKDHQKIYVKASKDGKSIENVYDLSGLVLEDE